MNLAPILKTKDGHELEYLGAERGLYHFRLRNLVRNDRYVGDFTRHFDVIRSRWTNEVFYEISFGESVKNPGSLLFASFRLTTDYSALQYLQEMTEHLKVATLKNDDKNVLEDAFEDQVLSLTELKRVTATAMSRGWVEEPQNSITIDCL